MSLFLNYHWLMNKYCFNKNKINNLIDIISFILNYKIIFLSLEGFIFKFLCFYYKYHFKRYHCLRYKFLLDCQWFQNHHLLFPLRYYYFLLSFYLDLSIIFVKDIEYNQFKNKYSIHFLCLSLAKINRSWEILSKSWSIY